MRYSFDDGAIGLTETNNSLSERLIQRPPGLSDSDWYAHAAATCQLLNKQAENCLIVRCESDEVRGIVEEVITGATGIRFDGGQTEFYDNYTDAVRYYSPEKGVAEVIAEEQEPDDEAV